GLSAADACGAEQRSLAPAHRTTPPECTACFPVPSPPTIIGAEATAHLFAQETVMATEEAGAGDTTQPVSGTPPDRTAQAAGPFGGYTLLRLLGEGGMGVVYEAEQQSLGRRVALKMIRAGEFATAADVQRFRNEASLVAALDHPHIVPVYDVGEHAGRHYFTMRLMEGGSLAQQLERFSQPREAAQRLADMARAVHFAHQH